MKNTEAFAACVDVTDLGGRAGRSRQEGVSETRTVGAVCVGSAPCGSDRWGVGRGPVICGILVFISVHVDLDGQNRDSIARAVL